MEWLLFSKDFLPESDDFQEVVKGRLMVVKAKYVPRLCL